MEAAKHDSCSECSGEVKSQTVMQEFEREGVRVEVSGIRALVCQKCGETYFVSGGAQADMEVANSLIHIGAQ